MMYSNMSSYLAIMNIRIVNGGINDKRNVLPYPLFKFEDTHQGRLKIVRYKEV